jgi:hypothetical protein
VHVSNTQNAYNPVDDWKLSNAPLSAYETKTKLKSRQKIYQSVGKADADFTLLDKQGNECKMLNEKVMSWALSQAGAGVKSTYQAVGTKYLFGNDVESGNGGEWIYQSLEYKENKTANTVTLESRSLPLDEDELVPIFKSMHYCKLLSPFRAMEWIYIDSLYAKESAKPSLFLQ